MSEDSPSLPQLWRTLWRMAWPVMVEQALIIQVNLVEFKLTGAYLTKEHLSALTLLGYLLWVIPTLFSAISIGATALVARATGAKDEAGANLVTHQALQAGLLLAIGGSLLCWFLRDAMVQAMRLEPEPARLAVRYLQWVIPALPLLMTGQVLVAAFRGAGYMQVGMVVTGVTHVVNAAAGLVLMRGWGPAPALGWDGLAWGIACGYSVGGLLALGVFLSQRWPLRVRRDLLRLDPDTLRRLARIGLPGGADLLGIAAGHLAFLWLINRLGTEASAAHGVALRVESLSYVPGVALSAAASTLVGQALGAGSPRLAVRSLWHAVGWSVALMTAAGLLFYALSDRLPLLFLSEENAGVAPTAARLMRIMGVTMPSFALLMVCSGGLRGAGDTRWPMVINFAGLMGVRLPLTWWLTVERSWDVSGAWIALGIDLTIRALAFLYRGWHGGWTRAIV